MSVWVLSWGYYCRFSPEQQLNPTSSQDSHATVDYDVCESFELVKCHIHDLQSVYMKLSGSEMSYTWPTVSIHKTVRQWNVIYMTYSRYTQNCQEVKCPIHDLQSVYTKLSGSEMSYTWPTVGIHKTVRQWNVIYMTYSRYTQNCQVVKCHIHDLQSVYTKLSGSEMSYTWPVVGIHKTVR